MERNRTGQVIAIVALIVGVVGLSVGFAAFSNTLTIKSSATVTPDSSIFNVDFSDVSTKVLADPVTPVVTPNTLVATEAAIDNTGSPTISNISATFTEPGQKAVYTFYAYNAGELDAYLKSIAFANATGGSTTKVCTAATGTTDSLVQEACNGITLSVQVGSQAATTGSVSSITGHKLEKAKADTVVVTLEYAENSSSADGDFTVAFGDVTLNYSSVD